MAGYLLLAQKKATDHEESKPAWLNLKALSKRDQEIIDQTEQLILTHHQQTQLTSQTPAALKHKRL